ncbi:MAG: hypothetical protein JNM25_04365 [Planctomycetes bacterium]|nr:hypothetical protein [Planctomycetota bacterium]
MIALAALLSLLPSTQAAPQDPVRPTGVAWQRSLADALAVQQATGLPLLIAVNMDGEVFNERFAGDTYKDPKFVESTRGYVCVVASPDRHTERDHDALGRRIECPRFPGCTCSEHIQIEPLLFERYFGGNRNAPRHVGVSTDGKILFDRFLDASMQTAIDAIARHRGTPKAEAAAVPLSLDALFARRDAASRRALEQRFLAADAATRRSLLAMAPKATNEPFELLRMALRDADDSTCAVAAAALAKLATKDTQADVENALARVDDGEVRAALVARLAEWGRDDPAAARLAAHLTPTKERVPLPAPWSGPWRAPAFAGGDRGSIEAELDRCEAFLRTTPNDDPTRLGLAIAQAAFADVLVQEGGRGIDFWFEDSRRNATRVQNTTLQNEAHALLAHVAYMTNDAETAARSTTLAQAPAPGARQPDPWLASRLLELMMLSTVNGVYADADSARRRILRAEIDRVDGALDLLLQRGRPTEQPALAGIGLLEFAGLRRDARVRLGQLVAALPGSAAAHERWRTRLLADLGPEAMRAHYARFVAAAADKPTAEWFAGYAALLAGEQHTRDQRTDVALSAYGEAVDRFARCTGDDEQLVDSAHHFAVLALAGRAHLRFAAGDAAGAVADLLRAAELRPASLDETDGLLRKPRAIAGRIARDLAAKGDAELAARLQPMLP